MPRYFFHVKDAEKLFRDVEGTEIASLEDAEHHAILDARQLLAQKPERGDIVDGSGVEICDADDRLLSTVPFKSVLRTG